MASGVPEHEVWAAADEVLARGERPTVERVRTELGRGSPARVGQLLERWWEQLAQRLKGHALLPDLPSDVAQIFAEAWRLALAHAGAAADGALTEQQNALFAEQMSLTQERKLWEIALTEAQANAAESASKLVQVELQLAERQILHEQLTVQVVDMRQQRDRLQERAERQGAELEALRIDVAAANGHIRLVEDRAHQEIDRYRQELKAAKIQHGNDKQQHLKRIAELGAERDALQAAVRANEQASAHQSGRIAALEAAIHQWRQASSTKPKREPRKATKGPAKKSRRPGKELPT